LETVIIARRGYSWPSLPLIVPLLFEYGYQRVVNQPSALRNSSSFAKGIGDYGIFLAHQPIVCA
jgi:hypothetical protein